MATLPFVVQPKNFTEVVRIGNDEIGIIEIVRKGYLSVAEKAFVDNVMQGSEGVANVVFLANKIAKESKVTAEKAYLAITEVMQGNIEGKLNQLVYENHSEEVSAITGKMAESMQRRALAAATILIQTRINHEWGFEDTLKLDPQFIEQLVDLYDKEEQREPVIVQTPSEEAAEVVGK